MHRPRVGAHQGQHIDSNQRGQSLQKHVLGAGLCAAGEGLDITQGPLQQPLLHRPQGAQLRAPRDHLLEMGGSLFGGERRDGCRRR